MKRRLYYFWRNLASPTHFPSLNFPIKYLITSNSNPGVQLSASFKIEGKTFPCVISFSTRKSMNSMQPRWSLLLLLNASLCFYWFPILFPWSMVQLPASQSISSSSWSAVSHFTQHDHDDDDHGGDTSHCTDLSATRSLNWKYMATWCCAVAVFLDNGPLRTPFFLIRLWVWRRKTRLNSLNAINALVMETLDWCSVGWAFVRENDRNEMAEMTWTAKTTFPRLVMAWDRWIFT